MIYSYNILGKGGICLMFNYTNGTINCLIQYVSLFPFYILHKSRHKEILLTHTHLYYIYIYIHCWKFSLLHNKSGAGTAYPSGEPEFTPGFSGVRVTRSLVLCVCFIDRCLSFCTFSFWSLCCLSFDLQILITLLIASNSSYRYIMYR